MYVCTIFLILKVSIYYDALVFKKAWEMRCKTGANILILIQSKNGVYYIFRTEAFEPLVNKNILNHKNIEKIYEEYNERKIMLY